MKKRMYRSNDVKKVKAEQLERLRDQVRDERVVFGIDVAKGTQYGALLDERREVLAKWKWDLVETRMVVGLLRSLPAVVAVAMEPTGTYGGPIKWQMEQAKIPVYRINPKRSKDYSEVYDGVPSQHDSKSAILIARLHLEGLTSRWENSSDEHRTLKSVVRELDVHDESYHEKLNMIEGLLGQHWPELTRVLKLTSVTVLDLLEVYGDPSRVRSSPEEAYRRMRRVGRSFLKSTKIELVLKSSETTLGVPMVDGERELMQTLAREARESRRKCDAAEARVKVLTREMRSVRALEPLLGTMTSAVLVTEVGNPSTYASSASFVKGFGLNLKIRSSGRYKGQLRITKRGPGKARRWLYMAVLRLVRRDPLVRAWYRRKITRDGGLKKKALTAVMRKLASSLWHVARGEDFDARKLFDARRLKGELTCTEMECLVLAA
jgi:hypothetical protein